MTGAVAGAPSPAALRALLDLAAVPMLLQDARQQILMVNSAFELATGFALAGPARFPIAELAHLRAWLGRVAELPAWQRTQPTLPPRAA